MSCYSAWEAEASQAGGSDGQTARVLVGTIWSRGGDLVDSTDEGLREETRGKYHYHLINYTSKCKYPVAELFDIDDASLPQHAYVVLSTQ